MKKILSLLTITALLGSSVALHARKPAPTQKEQFAAWVGPFLSEMARAVKAGEYDDLSKIMIKYQDQADRTKNLDMMDAHQVLNFAKWLFQVFYRDQEGIARPYAMP